MKYTEEQIKILKRKYLLSQSGIKEVTDRQGNEIPFCHKKYALTYITKTESKPDRETWKEGRLMEQLMIGGSSSHSKDESNELQNHLFSYKKKMDHSSIEVDVLYHYESYKCTNTSLINFSKN